MICEALCRRNRACEGGVKVPAATVSQRFFTPAVEGAEPSSAKAGQKRKGSDARDGLAGISADEARAEAAQLLRKSRLVSESGIGAVWGEPQEDIKAADAAIRAWRPIQACAPSKLLEINEWHTSMMYLLRTPYHSPTSCQPLRKAQGDPVINITEYPCLQQASSVTFLL